MNQSIVIAGNNPSTMPGLCTQSPVLGTLGGLVLNAEKLPGSRSEGRGSGVGSDAHQPGDMIGAGEMSGESGTATISIPGLFGLPFSQRLPCPSL